MIFSLGAEALGTALQTLLEGCQASRLELPRRTILWRGVPSTAVLWRNRAPGRLPRGGRRAISSNAPSRQTRQFRGCVYLALRKDPLLASRFSLKGNRCRATRRCAHWRRTSAGALAELDAQDTSFVPLRVVSNDGGSLSLEFACRCIHGTK